jgi:hypothetical protein
MGRGSRRSSGAVIGNDEIRSLLLGEVFDGDHVPSWMVSSWKDLTQPQRNTLQHTYWLWAGDPDHDPPDTMTIAAHVSNHYTSTTTQAQIREIERQTESTLRELMSFGLLDTLQVGGLDRWTPTDKFLADA